MRSIAATLTCLALANAASAGAATLQPIGSFDQPTYVTSDPADPERLFVAERLGRIVLLEEGAATTFADLGPLVGCPPTGCAGERGLMSIALAPDFPVSGRLYAFYAEHVTGTLYVDELIANGDAAALSTRRELLTIPHADANNHNGGQLQFGPDGALYVSTGDGGGGNDQFHHAQDLDSLLGKLLRIDPHPGSGRAYSVPSGNPFPTSAPPADTIWSYGLRNPFRFSFDRLRGDLVIADVGQGLREEIDFVPPGQGGGDNYGWNCREGLLAGPGDDLPPGGCLAAAASFTDPVFDYPHADPGGGAAWGCAIVGGYVTRDPSLGDLYGRYLYADLCVGEIRSLLLPAGPGEPASGDRSEGLSVPFPVSFGEDSCGRLYVVAGGGQISRIEGDVPAQCPPPAGPPAAGSIPRAELPLGLANVRPARPRVRLSAKRRVVDPGTRAAITARVVPCPVSRGLITLKRGGGELGTRRLDDECAAHFRPRILRDSTFRALIPTADGSRSPRSPRLRIRVRG